MIRWDAVVATDSMGGIGLNNSIPWDVLAERKYFRDITLGYPVLMGRKTAESLGKPLEGRTNIVLTRREKTHFLGEGFFQVDSIDVAVIAAKWHFKYSPHATFSEHAIKVIGGAEIYELTAHHINRLYHSVVEYHDECDTHFPFGAFNPWSRLQQTDYFQGDGFQARVYQKLDPLLPSGIKAKHEIKKDPDA